MVPYIHHHKKGNPKMKKLVYCSAFVASCAMLAFPIAYAIHLTITAILGD